MLNYDYIIRDPVHGDIALTSEEMGVLDTIEMQRLRDVRQLGAAHLVYPGAQHSRFEHSIGTAHLATKMVNEINIVRDRDSSAEYGGYDPHELRIVRLAALVHDSTHLPFGHNIEDQTGLIARHDTAERFQSMFSDETELGRALGQTGVREDVLAVLAPDAVPANRQAPPHWKGLVSGTIDADMLDYLSRDALFTGLKLQYDERIMGVFRVDRRTQNLYVDLGRSGYLKEAVLSEVIRCLEARFYFSERVYYHHAKIAVGALIAKAVEIALLEGVLTLKELQPATDAGLLELLKAVKLADPVRQEQLDVYLSAILRRRIPKRAAVYPVYANGDIQQELIDRFFGAGTAEHRREVEQRLTFELETRTGQKIPVLLYCPAGHMQLKQAKMLVRWPGYDELAPLSHFKEYAPRLGDLENSYQRMWKFYVLALTNDANALAQLGEICQNEFPGATNVLRNRVSAPNNLKRV